LKKYETSKFWCFFYFDISFVGVKKLKMKFVKKSLLFEKAMGKAMA